MTKLMMLSIALIALAGCKTAEEQMRDINAALPAGCTFTDLGSYQDLDHVVMVRCDERQTTTTSAMNRMVAGKIVRHIDSAAVFFW